MGVHLLKTFLSKLHASCIFKTNIGYISNRKIVIDISIYIYKFKMNENLLGDLKTLCEILKNYNIDALFVFDGEEKNNNKKHTIEERNIMKKQYVEEYNILNEDVKVEKCEHVSQRIKNRMSKLKRMYVRIDKNDIIITKNILDAFGFKYITANGEADELCALLVINRKAWACLTEDTDLYIYKCPIVINYLNIKNRTLVIHDLYKILEYLEMDMGDFVETCIMSGTDFNKEMTGNIFENMSNHKLYTRYLNNSNHCPTSDHIGFIQWLKNKKIINDEQIVEINKIKEIYTINKAITLANIPYILIKNKKTDYYKLNKLMNQCYYSS
jgi:flap endonuclease-1